VSRVRRREMVRKKVRVRRRKSRMMKVVRSRKGKMMMRKGMG
jgi:hypothetical protein